ncbi:hypothetical protein [[Clostridium] innocuum]|uniref:hypothetical protein n=1 Tax=Clostridium innocuum TaxID=1522 RepID=UPI0018CCF0FE|nr:hypothetical protein [[Clostridium] innocuum]
MDYSKELNRKSIDRLKKKIILAESQNLRTKNKSDKQMVNDIKKWIEEEVKCCSNQ